MSRGKKGERLNRHTNEYVVSVLWPVTGRFWQYRTSDKAQAKRRAQDSAKRGAAVILRYREGAKAFRTLLELAPGGAA